MGNKKRKYLGERQKPFSVFGKGTCKENLNAVETLPAFITAIYSVLHLADIKAKSA